MGKQQHFIKEWRKYRDLTQEQLAERVGVDRTLITHIEKFRRQPDLSFLDMLAEALRCEPADLIVRDPADPEGIWSLWDTLAPAERRQAIEIIKTIKRTGTEG